MKTIIVIGGGITGLSAMHEFYKWRKTTGAAVRLLLIEATAQLGGKIQTVRHQQFVMEAGADSIVARKMDDMDLIEELGLKDDVVYNATGRSFIYADGHLKPIPDDAVFGIPASIESLAKSTLVSPQGKVAALKDLYTKNETFTKNDSVGAFLEYFLGTELVEKQIAPVLSGVYSGNLSDLTIASTLPFLIDYKEQYGSIIKGLEANKQKFRIGEKKFFSLKNGLGSLIDAFQAGLTEDLLLNTKVSRIEKDNGRYHVHLDDQDMIEADYVVLSIPHTAAEPILNDPCLTEQFSGLKSSSLISVYIGFDVPDSVLPADGTGFITATTDELFCSACTWTSRKWEHTSKSGNLLVRLFYKSSHPSYATIKDFNHDGLLKVALSDIEKGLGITAEPVVNEITDWTGQMPIYSITHPQSIHALESIMADVFPGIILAGCSYYGVGITDCMKNGADSARKIIDLLKEDYSPTNKIDSH
ncbi:protoporphyrinogen oxidase [Paenibacillus whitsoniae]|uniref:Coproporphyrinogen III oxidase n=1 Tax=Paenibacillus whitsoniae TaxID=2496558 RepID=A0A430JEV4_9BACL|nr:protoporphyrinogen oxidase [Paenibacillus whitsoniae]RTE09582.1 protoporphyrinogen oxidase [Paenibacillus whitsoniae]